MIQVVPHNLSTNGVTAPASKSYAQRAILAATMCRETSKISNIGSSDDVRHILKIAKQLGADIEQVGDTVSITGFQNPIGTTLNCGESGLGVRLTTSIAAVLGNNFTITGSGSLLTRPMHQFEDFLPQLGVSVKANNGHLPLEMSGQLKGGEVTIDGSLSSQFLSGLMMALPLASTDSVVHIQNLKSKPYVKMTVEVMRSFGIIVEHNYDLDKISIPGKQGYKATEYVVEGDWSGASFWAVYGAIKGDFILDGLNPKSKQADIAITKALVAAGSTFEWKSGVLYIEKMPLNAFNFDATHCPDLFPPLVVLAAAAKGKSTFAGVTRLAHKESDRATVLKEEFNKLGLVIDIDGDLMYVHGTGNLHPGKIDSNNDHRIAMAGAIASILTKEKVEITDAGAVNKSYPEFWEHLQQ